MIININPGIVKHFDCLYANFPPEDARKAIEQDINTILLMHFDNSNYMFPFQENNEGWVIAKKNNMA